MLKYDCLCTFLYNSLQIRKFKSAFKISQKAEEIKENNSISHKSVVLRGINISLCCGGCQKHST